VTGKVVDKGWKSKAFHATTGLMDKQAFSVGAILAGGAGRRIGGHKATQLLAGKALVNWAAGALVSCTDLAVVGDAKAASSVGAIALNDPDGTPTGPLSGILAGLIWAKSLDAEFLVTIPCDTPFLPSDCANRLLEAAKSGSAHVACARRSDGIEPLVSAWRVETTLSVLQDALSLGRHPPVHALMRALNAAFVEFSVHETTNINTLASLLQAEAWLQSA
jgi:molybdenum cofactor guanylyltransferase